MNLEKSETRSLNRSFSNKLATAITSNRWLLFFISLLVTAVLALGILRSQFDTSLAALLSQSDPYIEELSEYQSDFPSALTVSFLFIAEDDESVFSTPILDAMADLEQHFFSIPMAVRVSTLLSYFSPEKQQRLFQRPYTDYDAAQLAVLRQDALADRLLVSTSLSDDGKLSIATVVLAAEDSTAQQRLEIADAATDLLQELRNENPDVKILMNSEVMLEQSSQRAMIDDLTTLLPFVILLCILTICYCFRSAILGICILSHTVFTIVCTVGALGFLGMAFDNISIIAPLVVVIIAVANSVHIISIFKQKLAVGNDSLHSMQQSIAYNFQPITLAALTTAIGFSSLNLCSSPAIQSFGRIVAIGIIFAYVFSLTILPALLIKLWNGKQSPLAIEKTFLYRSFSAIHKVTNRRDQAIFWSFTGLSLLTLMMLPLNETDFNRLDFIDTDSDIGQYYQEISQYLDRGPTFSFGIDTNISGNAIEPDFLHRLEEFSIWVAQLPNVESAASVVDLIKTINQFQNPQSANSFSIPENIDTIATHLNNYAIVQSADFPVLGFINYDFSMVPLIVNASPLTNQELIDLDTIITENFAEYFPGARLVHGSSLLLFARMDELVTLELLQGYSISLLLITICLMIGLRSVYFGILSVLPNLLPATIVFGLWGIFIGQLDPFVMMLFSISIGLVVDDTVHLLSHYLAGRRAGANKSDATHIALTTAGPALTITTLVLAVGTTLLIFANTLYFQQAAKLLVPIVVIALILDVLYLPTILKRFDNKFVADKPQFIDQPS